MAYILDTKDNRYDYSKVLERSWKKSGISLAKAAEELGITRNTLFCIMHGCINIDRDRIWDLTRIFDINIIEWCVSSGYVFSRVGKQLSPYALSIIKKTTGMGLGLKSYEHMTEAQGALEFFGRDNIKPSWEQ